MQILNVDLYKLIIAIIIIIIIIESCYIKMQCSCECFGYVCRAVIVQ